MCNLDTSTVLHGEVFPYKKLMGMCRWMGSHFDDWIDYNGVAFSIEFTRTGSHNFCFLGVRQFLILAVSKRTRMFVLLVFFIHYR